MSIVSVLPYFRARLDSLGYVEWRDAFDVDNIPENILDGAYHLTLGDVEITVANQTVHEFESPVIMRVFFKGYTNNDSSSTVDEVVTASETILASVLGASNRIGNDVKNIKPGRVSIAPKSGNNKNDLVLELTFTAQTMSVYI